MSDMTTTTTKTVRLIVELELNTDNPEAQAEMARQLVAYMTDKDSTLISDYGPEAWGGYDGPIIVASSAVVEDTRGSVLAQDAGTYPVDSQVCDICNGPYYTTYRELDLCEDHFDEI